jgi:hypothetical protein
MTETARTGTAFLASEGNQAIGPEHSDPDAGRVLRDVGRARQPCDDVAWNDPAIIVK